MAVSRTSKEYWNSLWQDGRELPRPINPRDRSLKNHVELEFDALFKETFTAHCSGDAPSLVELGCARSVWLPYFSKEFGFHVAGVDYSPLGCDQARALLAREEVEGEIIFADILRPPPYLLNRFDYVVSFGVVEHFEATHECLKACAAFLKPGGTLLTAVPNMNGLVGRLQKYLAKEVYDVHVPLDAGALRREHELGGLTVLSCEYFCFLNFGVLNLNRIRQSFLGLGLSRALNAISAAAWTLERIGLRLPVNRITSPYIVCISMKPTSTGR